MNNNLMDHINSNRYVYAPLEKMTYKSYTLSKDNYSVNIDVLNYNNIYYINSHELIYISLDRLGKSSYIDYIITHYSDRSRFSIPCVDNTIINKIKLVLSYVFRTFDNIYNITIQDFYFFNKPHNNEYIPSFYLDVFYHGLPWYAKYLHAKPIDDNIDNKLKYVSGTLEDQNYKLLIDNFEFNGFSYINLAITNHRDYYFNSKTFREFFDKIKEIFGDNIAELCENLRPWLCLFMDDIIFRDSRFISPIYEIHRDNYMNYNCDIVEKPYINYKSFDGNVLLRYR
jgi:hypothetical protein